MFNRFLKPSQVAGIDTEAFMRQQQIATNIHEQSILGYRGLTGIQIFPYIFFLSMEKKENNSINLIGIYIFLSFSSQFFEIHSDDRMQILQRFQPHCHFTNFEEVVFYYKINFALVFVVA